jgi:N-methylhydantoinase A
VPGPACYGLGGEEPTVTDADLVLGYLDPGGLAAGVGVSLPLARAAIDRAVAGPLGIETVAAAHAIHEIVNANMVAAIRVVTVQRGIDPREFALVGFGGAGPMHVARLADEFGIESVIVPWGAGVASAIGLVSADLGAEQVCAFGGALDAIDLAELDAALGGLEARARHESGHPADREFTVTRFAGVRVRGQTHHLDVPIPAPGDGDALGTLAGRFREQYTAAYGVEPTGALELTSLRVRVVSVTAKHAPAAGVGTRAPRDSAHAAVAVGERAAYFGERGGYVPTPVFDWTQLEPGARIAGPAIVEGPDTTIVVLPDRTATVDAWNNVVLGT